VDHGRRFVYVIQSIAAPGRHYVGLASDVATRLREHNAGQSVQTVRHRPWRLVAYAAFANAAHAERLAKDLKSASARGLIERYLA
jgi:predicted GIY-YIG superfamily endonuclease